MKRDDVSFSPPHVGGEDMGRTINGLNVRGEDRYVFLPIFSAIMLGLTRLVFSFDMLVFVAFVPLFYYFEHISSLNLRTKTVFFHGLIFSTVFLVISLHWISLVTVPGFIGILVLFGVVLGGMFLLVRAMYKVFTFGLIFAWLTFEFATNFTEFSFPWLSIAYGLKNSLSFLQILEIGGIPFLSFLILAVNYLFYLAISGKKRFYIIAFSTLLLWFIAGNVRLNHVQKNMERKDLTISLIQGNIEQDIKWEDDMLDTTFTIYEELSKETVERYAPNLIVFPESALPVYLLIWREYLLQLMELVLEIDTPIFTGFPHAETGNRHKGQLDSYLYFNAARLFSPDGFTGENYYKNILVPFGERFPFLSMFPILWKLDFGQANFERGESSVSYEVKDYTFSPLICFEIVFPLHLKKVFKEHKPDFWVNITNDAWFHRSIGTHQHAVMAVFRAIETRTSVFRVANTGYSFFTTPNGEIHQMTELFERTSVTGNLFTYKGITPFLSWGYMIPFLFLTFFALQIIGVLIFSFTRKRIW